MKLFIDTTGEPCFHIKASDLSANTLLRHYAYLLDAQGRSDLAEQCREHLALFSKYYDNPAPPESVKIGAMKKNRTLVQNKLFEVRMNIEH